MASAKNSKSSAKTVTKGTPKTTPKPAVKPAAKSKGLGKGIGKGIGALIAEDVEDKNEKVVVKEVIKEVKVPADTKLRISEIEPNREQPRKAFDEDALIELAESITKGLNDEIHQYRLRQYGRRRESGRCRQPGQRSYKASDTGREGYGKGDRRDLRQADARGAYN